MIRIKAKNEHSDDTDVEGTDLSKTEKEEQDDTDVKLGKLFR